MALTTSSGHIDHVGGPIAWREAGDGQPIVFLHGLGGTRSAWGPQLRGLSGRFRCVAWDMPGYGDSDLVTPLTYGAIADRLVAWLDRIEIDKADLVGLSFGGMHALHTTLRHPERVNRLVLADSSPAFGIDGTSQEEWTRSRLAPLDAGATPADAAEAIIDSITASPLTGIIRDETIAAFADIPVVGFRAAIECLPHNDVRADLPSITQPTRVIVGELDEETPLAYSQLLADGIPNAHLHVIQGVGHLTPSEAPDEFNRLVADFLDPSKEPSP